MHKETGPDDKLYPISCHNMVICSHFLNKLLGVALSQYIGDTVIDKVKKTLTHYI